MKDDYDFKNAKRGPLMTKDLKIEVASQDLVDRYEKEVMEILNSVDQSEAFITDYSDVFDLIPFEIYKDKVQRNKELIEYYLNEIKSLFKDTLSEDITGNSKIGELAQKLHLLRLNKSIHWKWNNYEWTKRS